VPRPGGCACVLALAIVLGGAPRAARADVVASEPGCGVMTLALRPGVGGYTLPHAFLKAGTDSAWTHEGRWQAGIDYALDPVRGELRVLRNLALPESLWISACWLLHPPPLEYRVQSYRPLAARDTTPAPAGPVPGTRPITARTPSVAPSGTSLNLTGNKTIAVDFGSSQDAFLRQSLDLALSGTLAPGVQLTGVLSDRNTPLSTTGATQDLQALDRVLLELTAPHGGATLGDLTLKSDEGEFARVERRLQGMSGHVDAGDFRAEAAAASAQGEYRRVQFFGIDGQQGPYTLTDRDGNPGVSVVAGSEIVTLDGERLTRGEAADYSMDYERARLSFTNRHLITSASRITVDYQFTVNRYRRNFAEAGTGWGTGATRGWLKVLHEGDDRARPLDQTFDQVDRDALAAAGDSAAKAVGPGVTPGGGDYDTVRVNPATLIFAFAGVDSGQFAVRFAPVAAGQGDYADSALVDGRTTYRWVGPGAGSFRVGRALPLPESHELWSAGGSVRMGVVTAELEGALSSLDRNTFSSLDDRDNTGAAARARVRAEGRAPLGLGGTTSLEVNARDVDQRFTPFTQLERPFEQDAWGLPIAADLEHQRRVDAEARWRPAFGGDLRLDGGRLSTFDNLTSLRRSGEWARDGFVTTRALWERADVTRLGAGAGGRDHWRAELKLKPRWLEPGVHAEMDRHLTPDTARVGDRFRLAGADLATGRAVPWHVSGGVDVRRDARAAAGGYVDQSESRSVRVSLDTPAAGAFGATLLAQRRDVLPLADPTRSRSDLASLNLRADDTRRRVHGQYHLEVTSEGDNRRVRTLTFVGAGRGAYDALGNFVGVGDYDLVVTIDTALERLARAASSAHATWDFGRSEIWRGSRIEGTFETETRRRGALEARDPIIAPGAALNDPNLAGGTVLQRVESELAPGSHAAAFRVRLERRVTADRSFGNFAQTTDDRQGSARWRARPGPLVTTEVEADVRRQEAAQAVTGGATFSRTLENLGGTGNLVYTPDARLRAAAALEVTFSRPAGSAERTRTVRLGPDLGVALGAKGRAQLALRRAFLSGPPVVSLLPTADPAGPARWDASANVDYRVRETTTLGVSLNMRDRTTGGTQYTGRAELRAFF